MNQKIKLKDINWAYTLDGSYVSALIVNKDGNRYKDLSTGAVYDLPMQIMPGYLSVVETSVAQNLDMPREEINVCGSVNMLSAHSFASPLELITNATVRNYIFSDKNLVEFCQQYQVGQKEIQSLTKLFAKDLKKEHQRQIHESQSEQEYAADNLTFYIK